MTEPLLNFHEAARRLRCSIRHVLRLAEGGRLTLARDERGFERVVEASLIEYDAWRAATIEPGTTSPPKPDALGPSPE
jgi:hypothetical protein